MIGTASIKSEKEKIDTNSKSGQINWSEDSIERWSSFLFYEDNSQEDVNRSTELVPDLFIEIVEDCLIRAIEVIHYGSEKGKPSSMVHILNTIV